jgi:serine/threonine protein kinase
MAGPPTPPDGFPPSSPAPPVEAGPALPRPAAVTDGLEPVDQPTLPHGPESSLSVAVNASLVGKQFNDYQVLVELGRGGMGVVYKARQISLDRLVAFKILRAEYTANPLVLHRFLTESRACAALDHPNIIKVYQIGHCSAGHFIAMEYIDGFLLDHLIKNRVIPISWAVSLMILVTEAVHYAHTRTILHRDLKPGNIMIDRRSRRPVVMDFGIAKFMGEDANVTEPGMVMGTPSYMPPEQAGEDFAAVGPHSDVYSLGAILYTMLTGKLPFEADTALRTILKVIAQEAPAPVRTVRPEVPQRLEQICMKCLQKRPADRYTTALALARDLRALRQDQTTQKPTPVTAKGSLASVLLTDVATGKRLRLFDGTTTTFGRGSTCDVVLQSPELSRRHCQIHVDKDKVVVEDLSSAAGTLVNGRPAKRTLLHEGDRLEIAGTVFQVRLPKVGKP